MNWVERVLPVETELVSLDPLDFEQTHETLIVPEEWCLYKCECGVTVGPDMVVSHLETHGESSPPELLARMVKPASETRGSQSRIDYETHSNTKRQSDEEVCTAEDPREWCGGPGAESVVHQCAECYRGREG